MWAKRAAAPLVLAGLGAMFWALGGDDAGEGFTPGSRAPEFSLPTTDGRIVSLASLKGRNALLYFNEGSGCDPCITQIAEIESHQAHIDELNLMLVPIMPNDAATVRREFARFKIRTPGLIDAALSVSRAYDTLGRGHHAHLPGHTFVLLDSTGVTRWRGDYPSMYVATTELLDTVAARLKA